jgi:hypothetical protein
MELSPELIRKHLKRLVEAKTNVESHTRTSKTGKVFTVQAHERDIKSVKVGDVSVGDTLMSPTGHEPMITVKRIDQARAPGYIVFSGDVYPKFKSSFPGGRYSAHKEGDVVIARGMSREELKMHVGRPDAPFMIGDQVVRSGKKRSSASQARKMALKSQRKTFGIGEFKK